MKTAFYTFYLKYQLKTSYQTILETNPIIRSQNFTVSKKT